MSKKTNKKPQILHIILSLSLSLFCNFLSLKERKKKEDENKGKVSP